MSTIQHLTVNEYFFEQTKKVFIDRRPSPYGIESFEKFLGYRYQQICYYYSAWAIMGLEDTDKLIRGRIDVGNELGFLYQKMFPNMERPNSDYNHGWVEFFYQGKCYVFDNLLKEIVLKEDYEDYRKPVIHCELTKKELIEIYTDSNHAYQENGIYHIKELDVELMHTAIALSKATIELDEKQKVKRFIAHAPLTD